MIAISIDPGKSGGISIIDSDMRKVLLRKCPSSPVEMADILRTAKNRSYRNKNKIKIAIEKVHAFPTDARSAAFKFGTNYGMWLGIIGALRIPMIEVPPQEWMKSFAPLPKVKQERKKAIKEIAIELLSSIYSNSEKITYAVSDAALISIWCLERSDDENNRK